MQDRCYQGVRLRIVGALVPCGMACGMDVAVHEIPLGTHPFVQVASCLFGI